MPNSGPERSGADVLVVSLGTTAGWRAAARELVGSLERGGTLVALVETGPARRVRTFALTDLTQALAARNVAKAGLAEHRPKAVIYCSVTAALLWPMPGAIWLDALATENRPGRHGIWQRPVERRRLEQAPLVLTMAERSLAPLADSRVEPVLVPVPVEPSGEPALTRDIAAIVYAGDPEKRRLEVVLTAWDRARHDHETLVVAGEQGGERPGVEFAGRLSPADYRALLRRARVFVAAPLREDYGIAPLEALVDGCLLVSTPAPGPYPALAMARTLDQRLVTDDLAAAIRIALDDPRPGYATRSRELLAPYSRAAVDRTVADDVLPRLLDARA